MKQMQFQLIRYPEHYLLVAVTNPNSKKESRTRCWGIADNTSQVLIQWKKLRLICTYQGRAGKRNIIAIVKLRLKVSICSKTSCSFFELDNCEMRKLEWKQACVPILPSSSYFWGVNTGFSMLVQILFRLLFSGDSSFLWRLI